MNRKQLNQRTGMRIRKFVGTFFYPDTPIYCFNACVCDLSLPSVMCYRLGNDKYFAILENQNKSYFLYMIIIVG